MPCKPVPTVHPVESSADMMTRLLSERMREQADAYAERRGIRLAELDVHDPLTHQLRVATQKRLRRMCTTKLGARIVTSWPHASANDNHTFQELEGI